jgi:S-DNA-T family DNA segregation ATPase FtsK/SpoIIIE
MTEALLRAGRRVVLAAPSTSPLRRLAGLPGVAGCLDFDSTTEQAELLLEPDPDRPVVVVDDAERFTDAAVGLVLDHQLRSGQGPYVIAAGTSEDLQTTYRGFTLEIRRSRCGLLLSPQSTLDGDLVGARLSRTGAGRVQAGRGILVVRGELTPIQVALPSPTPAPVGPL